MPPKKPADMSKKTEAKKKEKIIEDKTFGIKNKKGSKQQKFIKTVNQQVKYGNQSGKKLDLLDAEKKTKKDDKKKETAELNTLFKPVEQKVGKGVDPKSVLCAFFKQGQCKKGDKCKFSHDVNIGRKSEKKSMYEDMREQDTMEDWDEAKLEEVVAKKHGESDKTKPKTAIICKFFLEAVENSKYGWFWTCPNGQSCIYRHALPPGFILKKDQKKDDKEDEISLEEYIEKERASMSSANLTKLTFETFIKWKERKKKEKAAKRAADHDKKKSDYKQGKVFGISGREMFEFNPDLVAGDDEEADDTSYNPEIEEDEEIEDGPVREIDASMFDVHEEQLGACAGPGTIRDIPVTNGPTNHNHEGGDSEANKLSMAGALPPDDAATATDAAIAAAMAATINGDVAADVPIDENLFDGDDLDFVEDELETLDLSD